MTGCDWELLQASHSGDLLLAVLTPPTIARWIGVQRGKLITEYTLPQRLVDASCYHSAMDVGAQSGRLYSLLRCAAFFRYLRVLQPNGRLQSAVQLTSTAYEYRIGVDEQSGRVFLPYYQPGPRSGTTVVRTFDL